MQNIFLVGLGGGIGSILRYLVSLWLPGLSENASIPYGTLGVNVLGCLGIGLLGGWGDNVELFSPSVRMFLLVGLLGGFTTFSTFGYETIALLRNRELFAALFSVGLHLLFGFGAVAIGYELSSVRG